MSLHRAPRARWPPGLALARYSQVLPGGVTVHGTAENIDSGRSHKLFQSHTISDDRNGI